MSQKEDMHVPEGYTSSVPTHNGPILGIIVIIMALILGGLYLWGSMLSTEPVQETIINNEPETPRAEADVQILNTMSPSDDLGAIEADIENTDIDSLDAELQTIDLEIEAVFGE